MPYSIEPRDLIGNKIVDKITVVSTELQSKKFPKKLHSKNCIQRSCTQKKLIMKYQKKNIHLHKKGNKLLMNED